MAVKRNIKEEIIGLVGYLLIVVATLTVLGLLGVGLAKLSNTMNPIECRAEPQTGEKWCKHGDGDWVPR